jgi:hypothetical protein
LAWQRCTGRLLQAARPACKRCWMLDPTCRGHHRRWPDGTALGGGKGAWDLPAGAARARGQRGSNQQHRLDSAALRSQPRLYVLLLLANAAGCWVQPGGNQQHLPDGTALGGRSWLCGLPAGAAGRGGQARSG